MKSQNHFFSFILSIFLSIISSSLFALEKVNFTKLDWDNAKVEAAKAQKYFFVDFDASYCMICRNMDQSTYLDERLGAYFKKNVVAFRIDIQDFDGISLSQQYKVEALPTMIIFNREGKAVKRLEGFQSAADLLKIFSELDDNAPVLPNTAPAPPVVIAGINKPTSSGNAKVMNPKNNNGTGMYEVEFAKPNSIEGFYVQLGIYTDYSLVLANAERIRAVFPNTKIFVYNEKRGAKYFYRVLLDRFDTAQGASNFIQRLKQYKIEGIIKTGIELAAL
jgi:thioredoxin-related protein